MSKILDSNPSIYAGGKKLVDGDLRPLAKRYMLGRINLSRKNLKRNFYFVYFSTYKTATQHEKSRCTHKS